MSKKTSLAFGIVALAILVNALGFWLGTGINRPLERKVTFWFLDLPPTQPEIDAFRLDFSPARWDHTFLWERPLDGIPRAAPGVRFSSRKSPKGEREWRLSWNPLSPEGQKTGSYSDWFVFLSKRAQILLQNPDFKVGKLERLLSLFTTVEVREDGLGFSQAEGLTDSDFLEFLALSWWGKPPATTPSEAIEGFRFEKWKRNDAKYTGFFPGLKLLLRVTTGPVRNATSELLEGIEGETGPSPGHVFVPSKTVRHLMLECATQTRPGTLCADPSASRTYFKRARELFLVASEGGGDPDAPRKVVQRSDLRDPKFKVIFRIPIGESDDLLKLRNALTQAGNELGIQVDPLPFFSLSEPTIDIHPRWVSIPNTFAKEWADALNEGKGSGSLFPIQSFSGGYWIHPSIKRGIPELGIDFTKVLLVPTTL